MAKQCKLTADEFRNLVECPMSCGAYERRLGESGMI